MSASQSEVCSNSRCGHCRESHPFGSSGHLVVTGRCIIPGCKCRGFKSAKKNKKAAAKGADIDWENVEIKLPESVARVYDKVAKMYGIKPEVLLGCVISLQVENIKDKT